MSISFNRQPDPPAGLPRQAGDVLVLGAGRFGRLAAQRLAGRVMAVAECGPAPQASELAAPLWPLEAVAATQAALALPQPPAWVVPCVPIHFLTLWLAARLASQAPRLGPPPAQVEALLPLVGRGQEGQLYLSLTDTLCPDDCPEPASTCPKTGQPRPEPLFAHLQALALPGWGNACLRSRQLAPGVGGLLVSEMLELADRLAAQGGAWLVGTACRCHGVLQALELTSPARAGQGAP